MMKPSFVKSAKEVAQVYSDLAAYPMPQSAQLLPQYPFSDAIRTRCAYQVQDLASQKNRTLVKTAVVLPTGDLVDSDPVLRDPTTLWDVYCSGGDHRAVLLKLKAEGSGSDNADKFVVHVYNESRFIKSIDLSEKAKHGAVYGPELGACQWSYNEGHLLSGEAKSVGKQYDSVEHFGEQLSEYKRPVLCTLDVDSEVVTVLDDGIPNGVLPTEPCWAPDDAGVVFVGYKELPYQLGVIYCNQRPSAIYYLDFRSGECAVIGHDTRAVSSPRFSPCQTQLVWLQNEPSGPHKQCRRLIWCDWATKDIRFIIDFVNHAGSAGFPGIYADSLPSRCWSSNCRTVVLSSINRSKDCLLAIDVRTKIGELLPLPPDASSAKVLDFHRDWLVVEASAPNVPPFIAAGFIDASKPLTSNIKWTCLTDCFKLNDIAWAVWPVDSSKKKDSKKGDEEKPAAITELPLPLIAFPHGGPNTSFTATYMRYVCGLARCGYAVLVINYRGSLGFGKSTVDSLLGGIGERDVSDCIQAVEETLAESASSADKLRAASS
uniref:acylaminoacyl-peptidase n=1 Tax=Macrostomum lignano TaxID=282301 RepID=A0A1I8I8I5_9PLAT